MITTSMSMDDALERLPTQLRLWLYKWGCVCARCACAREPSRCGLGEVPYEVLYAMMRWFAEGLSVPLRAVVEVGALPQP